MQKRTVFTAAKRADVYLSPLVCLIHVYESLWEILAPRGWGLVVVGGWSAALFQASRANTLDS